MQTNGNEGVLTYKDQQDDEQSQSGRSDHVRE
jgi:hypothetical protein